MGALPNVVKLYGFLHSHLKSGQILTIRINASFPVASLGAEKSLLLTTRTSLGGQNQSLGVLLCICGALSYWISVCTLLIRRCCPRRAGQTRAASVNGQQPELA